MSLHSYLATMWLMQQTLLALGYKFCAYVRELASHMVAWVKQQGSSCPYYVQDFTPCTGNKRIFKTETNPRAWELDLTFHQLFRWHLMIEIENSLTLWKLRGLSTAPKRNDPISTELLGTV